MKRFFYLLIVLLLGGAVAQAQNKKVNETKQAEEALKRANKLFDNEKYGRAIEMYKDLLGTVASGQVVFADRKDELGAHLRLGLCYLYGDEQSLALQPLKQAHLINPDFSPILDFHLGDAYVYNRKYMEAVQSYQSAIDKTKKDDGKKYLELLHDRVLKEDFVKVSNKRIKEAKNAKELMGTPLMARIHNLGPKINTKANEYAPIISQDNSILIFTGSHDKNEHEDVLISHTKNRTWNAKEPWHHFNSKRHESAVFLSLDGSRILVYQDRGNGNLYESSLNYSTKSTASEFSGGNSTITGVGKGKKRRKRKKRRSKNLKDVKGSVSASAKSKDGWSKPKSLGKHINSKYRETSGCLSPDGNTLFFTSDRPGGLGGLDIYMSVKDKKGRWGKPVNLGSKVNTPHDEEAPFMHADGKTLYFSSTGHNSMGGFDIFKSAVNNGKDFSQAENMGSPINSQSNDMYFVSNDKGHAVAYFSSDRPGGVGGKDLYRVIMNPGSRQKITEGALLSYRVFFMYKKAEMHKKSLPAAKALLTFLKNNPGVSIEVSGHTDDVGSNSNNVALSQQRANVVYNWLVSKGIEKERLVKKGYGAKVPIIPNETNYARIVNRRTDFRVVSVTQQ
ncbi:OmpA family protein [Microscilla marina]|uniref:Outer membrane protein OmpA family n=1 Tax=Microscilla marina ATCC 23134 TaxID=313606 RepID=A1ZCE2_MICM2|nr:OmpA family protein [Microscilla marina]EAY31944.1 outer membrane protein OmpA family [Microscilla marina ATCC 23134]